jgi:hypothetical protein
MEPRPRSLIALSELLSPVRELQFAAAGNRPAFLRDEPFVIFLRVSWVSLAGCGAGEEECAFAGVAGKGGGAFELGAGFGVAA